MWRMIEARLRRRWWVFVALFAAGWAAAACAASLPELRQPERLATLAGAIGLFGIFIAQSVFETLDCRESRPVLHHVLPVARRSVVARRVVEPALVPLAAVAASLALAWLGRLVVGGETEGRVLVFMLAIGAAILMVVQLQIFVDEVQRQVRWRRLAVLVMVLILGGFGAVVGYALAGFALSEAETLPAAFMLFARFDVIVSLVVIAATAAELNRRLASSRESFV